MIHLAEHPRRHNMPVIVRPTKDDPVERVDQLNLRRCRVRTENGARFHQERMRVLLDGVIRSFPPYRANVLPKKIEPFIDMRDAGFLRRELQAPVAKNCSTNGRTSFSSTSLVVPVMMKSSAYRTK